MHVLLRKACVNPGSWCHRYGYMEVARQDETFVRELLGRVLHLLYKTLQERGSQMPSLVKDLGLPAGTELPVSFPAS